MFSCIIPHAYMAWSIAYMLLSIYLCPYKRWEVVMLTSLHFHGFHLRSMFDACLPCHACKINTWASLKRCMLPCHAWKKKASYLLSFRLSPLRVDSMPLFSWLFISPWQVESFFFSLLKRMNTISLDFLRVTPTFKTIFPFFSHLESASIFSF